MAQTVIQYVPIEKAIHPALKRYCKKTKMKMTGVITDAIKQYLESKKEADNGTK